MSKFPWTAISAATIVVAGLSIALMTRPEPAASPIGSPGQALAARAEPPPNETRDDTDPIIRLAAEYSSLVDKHSSEWDSDEDGILSWAEFIGGLDGALKLSVALQELLPDLSGDGIVTRAKARETIEYLSGVRILGSHFRLPGPTNLAAGMAPPLPAQWRLERSLPLRSVDGRVLNLVHFRQVDRDRSGSLDGRELTNLGVAGLDPQTVLAGCDADKDGQIALAEWWQVPIAGAADPGTEFRTLDANHDGYLDREELRHVPGYKLKVAEHALPGFDLDGDGRLSLGEYRCTPLANPLVDPNRDIIDSDGKLTFAEYIDRSEPFVLLYWSYFQRFDLNSDGVLSRDEYAFQSPLRKALYRLRADGAVWTKLSDLPGHSNCGSPQVSPDGKTVALDAHPVSEHGQAGMPMIVAIDVEGSNARRLCQGQMPTWSPDGRFIACSRAEGNSGLWIMTAEGREHRRIGDGWSAQWSPNGKAIAYYQGSQLLVYDLESGRSRDLLGPDNPYSQVFWNMCWSPDSKQICFMGNRGAGRNEVVLVDAAGAERGMKVRYAARDIFPKFAWHPYESRLVFCMQNGPRRIVQLFELDPKTDDAPQLVRGQNPNTHNEDPCWTPGGRWLILVSQ